MEELLYLLLIAYESEKLGGEFREALDEWADSQGLSNEEVFAWIDEQFGDGFNEWDEDEVPQFELDEDGNLIDVDEINDYDDFGYDDWSEYDDEVESWFNESGASGGK